MSKLYYRLNSLCVYLKQEKLIDDYDISHFKFEIDEKKLAMIIIHYGWNSKTTTKYLKNIKIASYF